MASTHDRAGAPVGPWGSAMFLAFAALVGVSVIFGGGSRDNALRLALVEVASLPLLFLSLRRLLPMGAWRAAWTPLAVLLLIVALPALQLVPLPPGLWAALPGREPEILAYKVAGLPLPWRPFTLSPADTARSLLALIPPAAAFLGALCCSSRELRRLAGLWIFAGLSGLALGMAQMFSPAGGGAYLYNITNPGRLVGFFANRNHEASFLVALLPLAAVFSRGARLAAVRPGLMTGLAWAFFLLVFVGLGAARSRAGILLAAPALIGALAVVWRSGPGPGRARAMLSVGGVSALAIATVAFMALTPILDRFSTAQPEQRFQAWPHVEQAAAAHLPLGAGIGAFDRVYRAAEPLELVQETYLNHAHNEYLEIWVEAGWSGLAVFAAGLAWFGAAAFRAWSGPPGEMRDLQRAVSVAVAVLLTHSVVDYPLRTTTLSVMLAFCAGVLAWRPGLPGAEAAQDDPDRADNDLKVERE